MIDTIILAGGLGTRSRSYLGGLPKCIAEIRGRPLLNYLLDDLSNQGIQRVCLALAHGREQVLQHLGSPPRKIGNMEVHCDLDTEQRGTAGAVKHVLTARLATDSPFEPPLLICNGDTLFKLDLSKIIAVHFSENAEYTTAVCSDVPVVRILSEAAILKLKESDEPSLEALFPPNRGIVYRAALYCFVDVGTADGYRKAQTFRQWS